MPAPFSEATRELGVRIRRSREELGATQRQIAEEAEIDETTYRKIELGYRNPNLHNLIRIASALGEDLGTLTSGLDVSMVPPPRERTRARESLDELKRQRDARRRG